MTSLETHSPDLRRRCSAQGRDCYLAERAGVLREVGWHLRAGHFWARDADQKSYFDTIAPAFPVAEAGSWTAAPCRAGLSRLLHGLRLRAGMRQRLTASGVPCLPVRSGGGFPRSPGFARRRRGARTRHKGS